MKERSLERIMLTVVGGEDLFAAVVSQLLIGCDSSVRLL
jgi:hypothetical protein